MIEINPVLIDQHRFLGVQIYLPKCTLRLLFNMKLICLDESFDVKSIEKKCSVPLIGCKRGTFEEMIESSCIQISDLAINAGAVCSMSVKEAIACVFQNIQ